jgi:glycosyltransferase involved in cell wall biosynthesis
MIYPAVTWPHKNHAVIPRALARLKEQGARPPAVLFTGAATDFQSKLQTLAESLGVASEVRFLGFVTTSQLQVLFRLARAMIFPSKFEGLGLPVLEAFRAELPVISSNATVLPEVAGDAVLYFDPNSPEQLAEAIEMLRGSEALRKDLMRRGQTLLQRYSADLAADHFASLYELVADVDARGNLL